MKILHVPQAYWPVIGGGEVLATKVSEGLAALGHDVHVVVANVPGPAGYDVMTLPPVDAPRDERRGGVHVTRYPYLRASEKTWRRLYTWPIPARGLLRRRLRHRGRAGFEYAVTRAIRNEAPDAVLVMSHHNANVVVVTEARRHLSFPLVYSPQLHHDQPGWRHELVRKFVSVSDGLTANTRHEAGLLATEYGADPERVTVTGCGVDDVAEAGPWPRARQVVYVGRKTRFKGIELLLDAMRIVWERSDDVELVLAGARYPETAEIDALIEELPQAFRRRLHDVDDVSEAEKDRLIRESTCLVLPSRYESFGIVLLEAWRHGTPVVALDRPVTAEIVKPEETGLLARDGDAASLADALLRLVGDPHLAERLGRAGRDQVARRHTWAHVAARYEDALKKVWGGSR